MKAKQTILAAGAFFLFCGNVSAEILVTDMSQRVKEAYQQAEEEAAENEAGARQQIESGEEAGEIITEEIQSEENQLYLEAEGDGEAQAIYEDVPEEIAVEAEIPAGEIQEESQPAGE